MELRASCWSGKHSTSRHTPSVLFTFYSILFLLVTLRIEPKASHSAGKCAWGAEWVCCMYMCVCVRMCVCVCVLAPYVHAEVREKVRHPAYHSSSYPLRQSLTQPGGSQQPAPSSQQPASSNNLSVFPHCTQITGMHVPIRLFMWLLGISTQASKLSQQALTC